MNLLMNNCGEQSQGQWRGQARETQALLTSVLGLQEFDHCSMCGGSCLRLRSFCYCVLHCLRCHCAWKGDHRSQSERCLLAVIDILWSEEIRYLLKIQASHRSAPAARTMSLYAWVPNHLHCSTGSAVIYPDPFVLSGVSWSSEVSSRNFWIEGWSMIPCSHFLGQDFYDLASINHSIFCQNTF